MAALTLALAGARAGDAPVVANLGNDYFSAAGAVSLNEVVAGSAWLVGGQVESNASIGGDAVIAGGQVALRATVGDDAFVAGGDVEVDALISGDARVVAGSVRIAPETRIEGQLIIAGGEVTLGGQVRGDVRVYANELTVLPGTRIEGRLSYRTAVPATIPPDVALGGGAAPAPGGPPWEDGAAEDTERSAGRIGWLGVLALGMFGLLIARLFPGFSARASAAIGRSPWRSLGLGLMLLLGVPVAAAAMFVTVIGIPVAIGVLLLYLVALVAGYVVGAQFIGDRLLMATRSGAAMSTGWRVGALLCVLLALALAADLPMVGSMARLAVLALGLGAFVLAR